LDTKLPIAETFLSVQGEGVFTGVPMFFIRLAGCNVGKFEDPTDEELTELRVLNPKHSICTSLTGERFLCDTNYTVARWLPFETLLEMVTETKVKRVCITGGEPFLHDVSGIVGALGPDIRCHIETSGTKPIAVDYRCWITCSPKEGFDTKLLRGRLVDEWKFLVGGSFTAEHEEQLTKFQADDVHRRPLYIQPIGDVNEHFEDNIARCMKLLERHPTWRLSAQLHKFIKAR